MTKGPGRSDCYRVAVTYGYKECLREGRVREKKLRRKFASPQWRDGLALSFQLSNRQNVDPERPAHLLYRSHCARKHYAVFPGDRISRKIPFKQ